MTFEQNMAGEETPPPRNGNLVFVCDDEPAMRRMLKDLLTDCGYETQEAADGRGLLDLLARQTPALILLDVRMPGRDGLAVLRDIRSRSNVPTIMLTAASDVVDKVLGLEFGADDYLTKPVDLRELQARIKAAIRRGELALSQQTATVSRRAPVSVGPFQLDLDSAKLTDLAGDAIPITHMEFSLLKVFATNKGRVLSREQLLDHTQRKDWDPFDRSVDLHISRLRRKLRQACAETDVIRTVRGLGYMVE